MAGFLASQWISDFLFAFGALFAIINPYGLAFVFLDRTIGLSDVDLLVQVRHRARADTGAPQRFGDVLDPADRDPCQIHLDQRFLNRAIYQIATGS